MTQQKKDPRLADTGHFVRGRKIIDDAVLLRDFERILEMGEAHERDDVDPSERAFSAITSSQGSWDRHGRQLLWLATKGAYGE